MLKTVWRFIGNYAIILTTIACVFITYVNYEYRQYIINQNKYIILQEELIELQEIEINKLKEQTND